MKKLWISIGLMVAIMGVSKAQEVSNNDSTTHTNLVFNGSFEDYRTCPRKVDALGVLTLVEGWYQPTRGSADYFNICGSRECGVPKNKLGEQAAHSGEGYCGIYCSKNNYREYLQTRLRRRLHPGDSIQITYYVSLSEESTGAITTMGALFTEESISDTVRGILMHKEQNTLSDGVVQTMLRPLTPQVVNFDTPLTDTRNWQCISGTFVAQGGEQYVTIGNFYTIEQSGYAEPDSLTELLPGAYYYIDDVTVECLKCDPPETDEVNVDSVYLTHEQPAFSVGGTFIMHDIFFEFDKSTLLQQSYFELMRLTTLLETYPKMRIEIRGHTDAKGADSYNLRLSENRAKAVADYLISKGVDAKRIRYKGYGKSQPIDSNDTEEGRAKNRRVEFKILAL